MQIAAALNAYNNPPLVLDTLDSIYTWMTKDVVVVLDAGGYSKFQDITYKDVKFEKGYFHNFDRNGYKNIAFSLQKMHERWPNADWYCNIEYDCLVVSNAFKLDLKAAKSAWILGNHVRHGGGGLPKLVNDLVGEPTGEVTTMLGCCLFYSQEFVKTLNEKFIPGLLEATKDFAPGYFPDFYGYTLEEELFPTLARHYGGKAQELAAYEFGWRGKYSRYPMRHPDPITKKDIFADTCIIHPLKNLNDPVRTYFRKVRERGNSVSA